MAENKFEDLVNLIFTSKIYKIYEKYYSDISLNIFYNIVKSDPTTPIKNEVPDKLGQYSKWLLFLFKKNKLKSEDLYKVTEYLTVYDELKKQNILPESNKDIGKISSLSELFELNSKFGGTGQITNDENYILNDKYFLNSNQAELFFENKRWVIIIPKTFEASKFYASSSQWCTRYPDNYKFYTKDGPLYIIIDKLKLNQNDATRRYQFHFESNQFMNMNDSAINISDFIKNNPSIGGALSPAISNYIQNSHDLNETTLSLLGVIAEKNHELIQKFLPALEERIRKGLLIPEQIIDTIPGLRKLQIKVYSEEGWTLEEKYFIEIEKEERQKVIEKKLVRYGSTNLPSYYFKSAENRLKVYYYKDLIKRGGQLSEAVSLVSDPKLINYYTEEMANAGKQIPAWVYNKATETQKEKYRQGLLKNKIHLLESEQLKELKYDEQKLYVNKYVNNLYSFMPNKFFEALPKELKNYYISKISEKKGLDKVVDFLTKEQYNWATTDGFL